MDFLDEVVVVFFRAFFFDENLGAIKVEKLLVQFLHFLQLKFKLKAGASEEWVRTV